MANVTTPFHTFVGTVDQSIRISGGATYLMTHGYGFAGSDIFNQGRDAVNGVAGKGVFMIIGAKAAIFAKFAYPGC